jgi:hypothetical protein
MTNPAGADPAAGQLVCANVGDCDDGTGVENVEYTLLGLRMRFPLCTSCATWFAKFYDNAMSESNRGK